jgi:uncharacterized membrane protein
MSFSRVLVTCIAVCVFPTLQLQAQKATCTNWNVWLLNPGHPNNPREQAGGVNDNRTVVGVADYPVNQPNFWGFVHYLSGKVTYWHPANAKYSWFNGRNNVGNTVGGYVDALGIGHAAYLHGSTTTLIVHPKAAHHSTGLSAVNNLNTLLGGYRDSSGQGHIFKRRSNGTFLAVPNFPGAKGTGAAGFNDNGVVVGTYNLPTDPKDFSHGFIYRNGSFATLNYRGKQTNTEIAGIDNHGVIVGNNWGNGFLYKNGGYKDIVGPHGELITVRGISANNSIVTGDMWISSSGSHGFTATCQ